jgi:transglutaminase-like putative cysteine protease
MHDLIMPSLTIRHVTTYRYRQPVAFGEHRMMLRPRDSHDQRVIEASLEISPEPRSLHFVQDAFGNHVGIARFSGRAKELCFESTVHLEHSPLDTADLDLEDAARTFPVDYGADEMRDLAYCIERHQPGPVNEVSSIPAPQWVDRHSRASHPASQGINHGFTIGGGKRRESSCRWRRSDSAMAAAAISPC